MRIIFLHVPKTGGTTFVQIVTRQFARGAVLHENAASVADLAARLALLPAARSRAIVCLHGHIPYGAHELFPDPAVYLTLLREPVDRFISTYYFQRRTPGTPLHHFLTATGITLEAFVDADEAAPYHDRQVGMLAGAAAPGEAEGPLARATRHAERHFALVGIMERFDETVLLCRRRMGWRNVLYVKTNVNLDRPGTGEVPLRVRDAIARRNGDDVELYAWARSRFDAALAEHDIGALELAAFRALNAGYGAARRTLGAIRARLRAP